MHIETNFPQFNYKYPIELRGHKIRINAVAISNNEKFIASGGWKTIILWEFKNQSIVQSYEGASILDLHFSQNNTLLAACQFEKPFHILLFNLTNLSNTRPLIILKGHHYNVMRIQFTQNSKFIISASTDSTIRIWTLVQKKCLIKKKLPSWVLGIDLSQDEKYIAASCSKGQVSMFEINSIQDKALAQWKADKKVNSTSFTPDTKCLLTCFQSVKIWSITDLLQNSNQIAPIKEIQANGELWSLNLRINGSILFSIDDKIRIWNLDDSQLIQSLPLIDGFEFYCSKNLAVSKDMEFLITGGKNASLKVYEMLKNQQNQQIND